MTDIRPIHVIGGGMAGCEAAWAAAGLGVPVVLHEMRPARATFAHRTDALGELVCSNSFRSDDDESNAVGLLHWEMRAGGSLMMECAGPARVPAGGALAVDRDAFAEAMTRAVMAHPLITVARGEVAGLPPTDWDSVIVATGPLTSDALAAALLIEPVNDTPHVTTPTRDFAELEQQLGQHYRAKIGSYFPEGHWALDNPKVLEGENGMLLVRDYQPQGDDIVELKPCAMIFFPRKREGTQPQSEAVILEAPQGALLEFEKGSDLSHARLGKLVHGQLRGEITIRGEMREPGPQDDLELITYDVQLNNKRIWTEHDVKFRLGPHYGEGKRLEIRLRPPEQTGAEPGQFGEVEAIQLTRDVQMHIELEGSGLIPESPAENEESQSSAEGREDSAQLPTPVEITCKGPFEFDLVRLRASFEQQVDVLRVIPTGPSDQLNCEYLAIHFETDSEKEKKRSAEEGEVPPIRPTRIEAEGRPVIVRSPSSEGHVRCERLAFDLIDNELTLEADREVMMFQGVNEIHAPALKYRPSEYRGGVPLVWAAGPGWLRTAPGEDKSQIFQLRWNQELHLRPHDDAHVLSISGRPQMRMTELGQLTSDEVHFWLREKKAERDAAQKKDEQMVEVQPDRMMAEGEVQVESPQLTGATERLELWFQQVAAGPKTARTANSDNDATKPDNRPVRPAPAPREAPAESRLASEDSYDVRGKLIRLQVQVADRENMQVTDLAIDGDVKLRQTKMATPDEQPLWIEGDRLQMADADGPNAQVAVTGQPAKISVRGLTLEGKAIELDRATNQVKIDGAGMMKAPIDRDLEGRRIEKTEMLSIDFSGGMNFDGQTIRFERDVVASTQSQKLRTMFLDVSLRERVDFGGSVTKRSRSTKSSVASRSRWKAGRSSGDN